MSWSSTKRIESWLTFLVIFQIGVSDITVKTSGSVIVTVSEGQLQGLELMSRENRKYYGFLGIPYGIVSERFEPSGPHPSWNGIHDATQFGAECPQISLLGGSLSVTGDENCLFLNVFTPNLNGTFPVIVHIHGGAFSSGSGNLYGGAYFLDENVILVTINYRLGALGFLNTDDGTVQGNAGLKDQNLALRWISLNIAHFGGDVGRITLMGDGAGAASVAYHLLSPLSKGLFHQAILQSGSALDPTHFDPDPLSRAIDLAESLDCPTSPIEDLVTCLKQINFRKVVQIKLRKWHIDPLVQYAPSIEIQNPGESEPNLFLTEDPFILLQEGRFNRVPCIIGITEDEGLLFHSAYVLRNKELQRNMNEDWNYVAPITLYYDKYKHIPAKDLDRISRTIRGFYFGNKKINPDSSRNLTNLYSDRLFNWGVRTTALLQSRFSPVYTYIFGYLGDFSVLQLMYGDLFPEPIAPTHGDDLQYFFNSSRFPTLERDSRGEEMSKILIKLWAWFASTGNMMKSLETLKIAWLPIGPEEIRRRRLKWCYIDSPPPRSKIISWEPFKERMDFWDNVVLQLRNAHENNNPAKNDPNLEDDTEIDNEKDKIVSSNLKECARNKNEL